MPQLIAILVFVVVALVVFVVFSLLDERKSRARVLRDRLSSTQDTTEHKPLEDIALLRDEMLSEIPALDNLLRRSMQVARPRIVTETFPQPQHRRLRRGGRGRGRHTS